MKRKKRKWDKKTLGLTKKQLIKRITLTDKSIGFRPSITKKQLEKIYRKL